MAAYRIYLREVFSYPAASFIWVVVDVQSALILPAVWLAAAGPSGIIAGMDRSEIVTYYIASATLSSFITCHLMWDMAWDIKEGEFSAHLMRPLSYFWLNAGRNMAWRVAKLALFVPVALVFFLAYGSVGLAPMHFTFSFLLSVLLAHTLSYCAAFCLAMLVLWTTEYHSVLRLFYFPEWFLSGRLVPLTAMPAAIGVVATFTHFRYTNYFSVEILLGRLSVLQIQQGFLVQVGWIVFFLLLGRVMFKAGVKRYSGVGM